MKLKEERKRRREVGWTKEKMEAEKEKWKKEAEEAKGEPELVQLGGVKSEGEEEDVDPKAEPETQPQLAQLGGLDEVDKIGMWCHTDYDCTRLHTTTSHTTPF